MRMNLISAVSVAALTAGLSLPARAALAQSSTVDEIVVTARKREEALIEVPVAITALNAQQLNDQAIDSIDDLASVVPSLSVGQVSGGIGGTIVLRGVGTTAGSNPSFEQTVVVNIDGVQISRGTALRLGQIDMASVEVLRGPQALFFGKNSPAGVISVRTADPGNEFEASARLGYEAYGREKTAEVMVSGPLTDTLGARLVVSGSDTEGWMENRAGNAAAANAIRPGATTTFNKRGPEQTFIFTRGTVKWDPTDRLSVRAKGSYSKADGIGYQQAGGFQRIYCPNGIAAQASQATALNGGVPNPALAVALAADDCKADKYYANGNINPAFLVNATNGVSDVQGKGEYTQSLGSVEVNYDLTNSMTVTSVTGYTEIEEYRYDTYGNAPSDALSTLDFVGLTNFEQLSQELRLASDFSGPLNFMVGGFYEDSELSTFTRLFANGGGPLFIHDIEGKARSVFGQLIWDISDTLELAGGARISKEEKSILVTRNGVPQPLAKTNVEFEDTSPEATLTWRPSATLTLYGAYKQGFKSGGFAAPFNTGNPLTPGQDISYRPESVEGYELGLKAILLDGQLTFNSAVYDYDYANLQVNSLDNSSGVPVIRVTNAAAAKVRGLELDAVYKPAAVEGLQIRANLGYNDANYTDFLATCYIGQTIAQGCTLLRNPATGQFTGQQLGGQRLVNAPEWNGSAGFSYERDIGAGGMSFALSSDARYKSEYNPHPELHPGALQKSVVFLDASARLRNEARGWEVALIGRNLTDEYRVNIASNAGATGVGTRTGTAITGGLADLNGNVNRGREVLLQVTVKPALWF